MKRPTNKTPRRDAGGRFISDTQHVLERLVPALAEVSAKRTTLRQRLADSTTSRNQTLTTLVSDLVPDLEAMTISRLKRQCVGVVNQATQKVIDGSRDIVVPWIPYLLGESVEYKDGEAAKALASVRLRVRSWLESQNPMPIYFNKITGIDASIASMTEEDRTLAEQEAKLKSQIDGLNSVIRTYSRPDAPEPPKNLQDAISKSADGMRSAQANAPIAGTGSTSGSGGGMDIWDYMILDSILNDHHRYDRDGSYTRGSDWPANYDRSDMNDGSGRYAPGNTGGGSSRMTVDDNDRDGGGGSTRMAASDRDGGGGSTRMSGDDSRGRYS